jgi:hypothetical protein
MLGAVSQKVGFGCVQALGSMECNEAIFQLTRLRARVKYSRLTSWPTIEQLIPRISSAS